MRHRASMIFVINVIPTDYVYIEITTERDSGLDGRIPFLFGKMDVVICKFAGRVSSAGLFAVRLVICCDYVRDSLHIAGIVSLVALKHQIMSRDI